MPFWLQTTLLGMGTVFVGLVLLVLITMLLSRVVGAFERRKENATMHDSPLPESTEPSETDGAMVAVIAAALAAAMGANVNALRIHSIRKLG